jgi:hypothetical protein
MAPPGNIIGYMVEELSCSDHKYFVQNASGESVVHIELCRVRFRTEGHILSNDGLVQVAKITGGRAGVFHPSNDLLIQNMTSLLI